MVNEITTTRNARTSRSQLFLLMYITYIEYSMTSTGIGGQEENKNTYDPQTQPNAHDASRQF